MSEIEEMTARWKDAEAVLSQAWIYRFITVLISEVTRLQDEILRLEEKITHLTLDKLLLKSRVKYLEER